jgi:hypothetical protein
MNSPQNIAHSAETPRPLRSLNLPTFDPYSPQRNENDLPLSTCSRTRQAQGDDTLFIGHNTTKTTYLRTNISLCQNVTLSLHAYLW